VYGVSSVIFTSRFAAIDCMEIIKQQINTLNKIEFFILLPSKLVKPLSNTLIIFLYHCCLAIVWTLLVRFF
jgi:hypothetical protein